MKELRRVWEWFWLGSNEDVNRHHLAAGRATVWQLIWNAGSAHVPRPAGQHRATV